MHPGISRRRFLVTGLKLPVGIGLSVGLAGCGGEGGAALVCADPATMSSAQESVRRTLNYVEVSDDPARTCSACDFFTAAAGSGCGSCGMFDGGAVNPGGRCDSWSVDS